MALPQDDLLWEVQERSLYLGNSQNVRSHKAVVRYNPVEDGDKFVVLGVHSNRYEPVKNAEVRDFADIYAKESGGTIRGSWSVNGGKIVSIQVEGGKFIIPGDPSEYDDFMSIGNSHDGSLPFVAHPTQVRVECENTFFASLRKGGLAWTAPNGVDAQKDVLGYRLRHTSSIHDKIAAAQAAIKQAYADRALFAEWAESLMQDEVDWDRFVNVLVPAAESERESAILAVEEARSVLNSVRARRTNDGIRQNAWGTLNAGIEYLDHFETPQRVTKTHEQRKLLRTVGYSNEKAQRLNAAMKAAAY